MVAKGGSLPYLSTVSPYILSALGLLASPTLLLLLGIAPRLPTGLGYGPQVKVSLNVVVQAFVGHGGPFVISQCSRFLILARYFNTHRGVRA